MSEEIRLLKHKIAAYAKELYDRHLTDAAGGNISVRIDDKLYMTPRYGGSWYHWGSYAHTDMRSRYFPDHRYNAGGFRIVLAKPVK